MCKLNFLLPSVGLVLCLIYFVAQMMNTEKQVILTTWERISQYGYTTEEHTVLTKDGYILTVFRITSSPKFNNGSPHVPGGGHRKPAVLLQHGLICSSDSWLMTGPQYSLPYLLADAGFDVWLGNARGNRYSQRHRVLDTQPGSSYWNYSTHEIGVFDVSATIDYIGHVGGQPKVHFVGYSAGTTAMLMLLAVAPQYNDRISSMHLLSPITFMSYRRFTLHHFIVRTWLTIEDLANRFVENFANKFVVNFPFLSHSRMLAVITRRTCADGSSFQWICKLLFLMTSEWNMGHMNTTLLPKIFETHPDGASTTQILHYMQLYNSGDFRQFDHGVELNKKYYQQETPPAYNLSNIRSCANLYYSDNDFVTSVEHVEYLATLLPCSELYRVPYEDWNHYDFITSVNVKEVINDRIIDKMIRHEQQIV